MNQQRIRSVSDAITLVIMQLQYQLGLLAVSLRRMRFVG